MAETTELNLLVGKTSPRTHATIVVSWDTGHQSVPRRSRAEGKASTPRTSPTKITLVEEDNVVDHLPRTPPPKDGESEIKFINNKKHYWCSKCNCWTLLHGTDANKSKEELKSQPKPNASMACANFDFHPTVFKLCCIPLTPVKEKPPKLTKSLILWIGGVVAMVSGFWWLTSVCPDLPSNGLISIKAMLNMAAEVIHLMKEMIGSSVMYIKEQVPLIAKTVSVNWLSIAMAGASGAIGFGIASCVCHQSEGNATHVRMGRNHLKKVWRMNKPRKLSCRSQSVKSQPIWVPPDDCSRPFQFCSATKLLLSTADKTHLSRKEEDL